MAETPEVDDIPWAGDEFTTLHGALERIRGTVAWKCGGLEAVAMRATLGPSRITLGGLLTHLAFYEDYYFSRTLMGRDLGPPWDSAEHDVPDWEWRLAEDRSPAELMALWQASVTRSRASVADALADGGLGRVAIRPTHWEVRPSLRRLLVDMNEEYARHAGHADLIRESIDGLVGEDPPPPE